MHSFQIYSIASWNVIYVKGHQSFVMNTLNSVYEAYKSNFIMAKYDALVPRG